MPPLREHLEDLQVMAEAMVHEMNQKHTRHVSGLSDQILDRMLAYDWPGNARELRNTIERAVILCPDGAPLDAIALAEDLRYAATADRSARE